MLQRKVMIAGENKLITPHRKPTHRAYRLSVEKVGEKKTEDG
jgi:hypothetical protein